MNQLIKTINLIKLKELWINQNHQLNELSLSIIHKRFGLYGYGFV